MSSFFSGYTRAVAVHILDVGLEIFVVDVVIMSSFKFIILKSNT